jgi:alpha-L-fucosidase 2
MLMTLPAFAETAVESYPLTLNAPSMTWDEALPLGNGLLGALVWGDGAPLKISLDRTDLWDLRPVPEFSSPDYSYAKMREWVKEGRIDDLHRLYDAPYGNAGPTKIPAGRIEIRLPETAKFIKASLPLTCPSAALEFSGNLKTRVLVHATEPVGMIEIESPGSLETTLIAPSFSGEVKEAAGPGKISPGDLASLGYPAPAESSGPNWKAFTQEGWGGFRFAVYLAWKDTERIEGKKRVRVPLWRAAWSIATSTDGSDPLEVAKGRVEKALDSGWDALQTSHLFWWLNYWQKSSIHIPDPILERQWYLEMYKFGAAARRGAPPISLQGPWTADDGKMPPWKGDYHHDLNTELCYWPCYESNHLEEGLGYLDWLWKTKGTCEEWTQQFFGKPGLNVPMTSDLNNTQIGGWHQYTHSSTTAAWLAHHFYMHWRYSMDRDFLKDRAYPYLKGVATFLEAVTEKGEDGKRTLPLSASPEINDDHLDAWFKSITNFDLALARWAFQTCAELADELGLKDEAGHWRSVLSEMPDFACSPDDHRLLVARDYPLPHSHRHFSHLLAIHPLGLIRWENGEVDQKTISAALSEMDRLGTSEWCGYSFAWKGSMAARARDGVRAVKALDIFSTAFCLRNSFHANGDQSSKGFSNFKYRPFTLEGNFAAAQGIQEMLLQSYSGTLRVFPAIPPTWKQASFQTLRAEGAFLVSAERQAGKTLKVDIVSEKGGTCRLEDPFGGAPFNLDGIQMDQVERKDSELSFPTKPGQKVTLSLKGAAN